MKIDTMLVGLEDAPAHARRLEQLGVDGAFTFEGPHDVFTPLVLAADATTDELIRSFSLNPSLQAVLITETGDKTARLQGLATWGDALRVLGE